MDSHSQSVLANIRAEVARRRLSQSAIAAALGVSQQSVSKRLNGHVPLTVDELGIIAGLLDITPADLLSQAVAS